MGKRKRPENIGAVPIKTEVFADDWEKPLVVREIIDNRTVYLEHKDGALFGMRALGEILINT